MKNSIICTAAILLYALPAAAHAEAAGGARAEVTVGYDRLSAGDHFQDLPNSLDGTRLGGALGYDLAVSPHVLLGIEADAGWTLGSAKTVPLGRDRLTQKLGRDLGLSLRVTVPVTPAMSLFAKAGYANSRFDVRYDAGLLGNDYETIRSHVDRSGVRLGFGVEQAIAKALYAKLEYRWTHYGDSPYLDAPNRSQVLVGFGTRF